MVYFCEKRVVVLNYKTFTIITIVSIYILIIFNHRRVEYSRWLKIILTITYFWYGYR